jgi:hypothetical protein
MRRRTMSCSGRATAGCRLATELSVRRTPPDAFGSMSTIVRLARAALCLLCLVGSGCGGFVGELYVSRSARLTGHLESTSGRIGVPCTVTARVLGRDDTQVAVTPGRDFSVTVSMGTPLRFPADFRPRVALRVGCEGHLTITTAERQAELGWIVAPATDFGRVSVPADN